MVRRLLVALLLVLGACPPDVADTDNLDVCVGCDDECPEGYKCMAGRCARRCSLVIWHDPPGQSCPAAESCVDDGVADDNGDGVVDGWDDIGVCVDVAGAPACGAW